MATSLEKLQGNKAAAPIKIKPNDPERLFMSRDQVILKDRKIKEIEAKLAAEKARLEEEAEKEQEALQNVGAEDVQEVKKVSEEE